MNQQTTRNQSGLQPCWYIVNVLLLCVCASCGPSTGGGRKDDPSLPSKGVNLDDFISTKTFETALKNTEVFQPRLFVIYEDHVLSQQTEATSFQDEFLAKSIEGAKTLVFVKVPEGEVVGKYVKGVIIKEDTGIVARTERVTICLIDLSDPKRKRVIEGYSTPPTSIGSTGQDGGETYIDGVEYYSTHSERHFMLEEMLRVAMQKRRGFMGLSFKGDSLYSKSNN